MKVQVINAVLKKHMKIVREAIFHAPVKGNNLRTCCTPEIPNSENSLARFLAPLCFLRKLMISCEIGLHVPWVSISTSTERYCAQNSYLMCTLLCTLILLEYRCKKSSKVTRVVGAMQECRERLHAANHRRISCR